MLLPVKSANLAMLAFVSEKFGDLCSDVVFLGGCATALLISDAAAPDLRHTLDVDCIIDVISLGQYSRIEQRLREKGFSQRMMESVICRWYFGELILDIMPTDEKILGFSNCWYKAAIDHRATIALTQEQNIHVVTAPYFLVIFLTPETLKFPHIL